jgi:S-adenosylmethionine/arginine decarboxylase-like enzyme
MKEYNQFIDLAPMITRRRLIVEATLDTLPPQETISEYMIELSNVMNMTIVSNPSFNYEEDYGLAAYMCWKESGMHVYTWKEADNRPNFVSIDIYTCKDFELKDVINFTKNRFGQTLREITWRE